MPIPLYIIIGAIAGVCFVGFIAALRVHQANVRKNPSLPSNSGRVMAWSFVVIMLLCLVLAILFPPCR